MNAAPDTGPSLRARLLTACGRIAGAPERDQIMRLLRAAPAYRVDDAAAAALSATLAETPWSIERNLDLARIPSGGIWIEYADAPRRPPGVSPLPGARHPVDVGTLICPDPDNDDRVVMVSAWDFEETPLREGDLGRRSVRHSYAVVAFSREDVSNHAFEARHRYGGAEGEALSRILGQMHPYVPEGFAAEMLLTSDVSEGDAAGKAALEDSVMRDVTSEAPFALAALMLMSSAGAVVSPPSGESEAGSLGLSRKGPLHRLKASLSGTGFRRAGRPRSPRLSFLPAA